MPNRTPTFANSTPRPDDGQPDADAPISFAAAARLRQTMIQAPAVGHPRAAGIFKFPARSIAPAGDVASDGADDVLDPAAEAMAALETMSRRMEDLARALNCLGHFEDDDGRPRAA